MLFEKKTTNLISKGNVIKAIIYGINIEIEKKITSS